MTCTYRQDGRVPLQVPSYTAVFGLRTCVRYEHVDPGSYLGGEAEERR